MRSLFSTIALGTLLLLPAGVQAQDAASTPFTGSANIASPGINGVPCGPGMPRGDCPSFNWSADFIVPTTSGGTGWSNEPGELPFASCAGNVHQSTMDIGNAAVSYTGVCVGLLCEGGGAWGSGVFGAGLVFVVGASDGAQCLDDMGGFRAADFNGAAVGATAD